MRLADYLGRPASSILESDPFSEWGVERSTEEDLPGGEVYYDFANHGLQLICDEDERIRTIFLRRGSVEALSEVLFTAGRGEVVARFGSPSQSGAATTHPILGDSGAWDRFSRDDVTIHVQYHLNSDEIDMITLIRSDAVP